MLKFFTLNNFRKEMTIVIIVKLLLLFLLWSLFFSHHDPDALSKSKLVAHFVLQDGAKNAPSQHSR